MVKSVKLIAKAHDKDQNLKFGLLLEKRLDANGAIAYVVEADDGSVCYFDPFSSYSEAVDAVSSSFGDEMKLVMVGNWQVDDMLTPTERSDFTLQPDYYE